MPVCDMCLLQHRNKQGKTLKLTTLAIQSKPEKELTCLIAYKLTKDTRWLGGNDTI